MWKTIEENPLYEICDAGIVRRTDNGATLQGTIYNKNRVVMLKFPNGKKRRFWIDRLVAKYFISNEDIGKMRVWHKDWNQKNCKVENLEWVTKEERAHRIYQKEQDDKKARKQGNKPIPVTQFDLNGNKIRSFSSIKAASVETKVPIPEIAKNVHKKTQKADNFIFKITEEQ